ncbi:MAG: TlpA family protein disulfide reductase [Gemmatimonadetes bacterium]|nr:TlpA family protein disulfide reductase [Gemmatimonadota bacterium]
MRRLVSTGGIAAALLLALPLAGQGESGIPLGTPAPVVSVNDLDGKAVDLGQWVGKKPVLIEFWATWCSNCEELLPRFVAAHREFGDRVEFLGVNVTVNQTPERVRRYLAQHTVPFRILYDDRGASTRAYQAPATSFVVILDAAGRVVYTGVGADQRFEPALKQVAGAKE